MPSLFSGRARAALVAAGIAVAITAGAAPSAFAATADGSGTHPSVPAPSGPTAAPNFGPIHGIPVLDPTTTEIAILSSVILVPLDKTHFEIQVNGGQQRGSGYLMTVVYGVPTHPVGTPYNPNITNVLFSPTYPAQGTSRTTPIKMTVTDPLTGISKSELLNPRFK